MDKKGTYTYIFAQHSRLNNGICHRLGVDFNDANSRVVGASIVGSIAEIAKPVLQRGRVVLSYLVAVIDDRRRSKHRSPLSRSWVQEAYIHPGIFRQVIGFTRFRVGMEDQLGTSTFLHIVASQCSGYVSQRRRRTGGRKGGGKRK